MQLHVTIDRLVASLIVNYIIILHVKCHREKAKSSHNGNHTCDQKNSHNFESDVSKLLSGYSTH